ncbi:MAG: aminotransferase class I/II-fold pyridoxal phosphate-dependent enzyme [Clostridia bacterium]|nr:aminotransferase class I/II-fold pyridoxal phosphate-dependent enzyme [Clostridia bacterium]NCC42988.1 aminotransferase class I/II-fold pyridoxal phosphate-dependent enzyme [Clostridia bacterium]
MKYDFTSIMDRKGMDATAVDLPTIPGMAPEPPLDGFSQIPMWVADMNFPTCPTIPAAIIERAKHPAYGYFEPREEYFQSIIDWQTSRNHFKDLTADMIGYENGVLGGAVAALNAFTSPGENILVHSPTYIGFTHAVEDCGRKLVHSPLVQDENNVWRMDYEDMDAKIKANKIHVAIFCNPHNPVGRVWEKEEIKKALEVYKANQCIVISDEIWSDIILYNNTHIPTLMATDDAKDFVIGLYAPSKTFNLAGLIGSYHIVYNKYLRERMESAGSRTHYNSMNVLSMHALIGAYKQEGHEWTDELCQTIGGNIDYACSYISEHFKGIHFSKPQATYMLFLDCEEWCRSTGNTLDDLLKAGWDVGIDWQDGRPFHGAYAIRVNFALPLSLVKEAMDRLDKYVFNKKLI